VNRRRASRFLSCRRRSSRPEFGLNALHGGPDSRSLPFPQNVDEVGNVIAWVIDTRKLDVYTRPGSKPRVTEFLSKLGEDPPSSVLAGQWDAA
jgi:hypothetical protein